MKNKIIEDIKTLKQTNPTEYKELKQEFKNALAYQSTDDEGHSKDDSFERDKKQILVINKDALEADKWGNCKLSEAIEDGNMTAVREICNAPKDLNDNDLLKKLFFDMVNESLFTSSYGIDKNTAFEIHTGAEYQLKLAGENVEEFHFNHSGE